MPRRKTDPDMPLGDLIKSRGTVVALAQVLGMPRTTLGNWAAGRTKPAVWAERDVRYKLEHLPVVRR